MLRLQQSRRQLLVFVQGEKEREGEALLQLYRERASGWASSRRLGEMEARLAALQTTSTHTHTHLTRVRLAIVNIYCVARAYQRSLPPLGPRASTSTVLKRLHNFLLDAITVTTTARGAIEPASLRPSVGTHKQKKGAAAAAPAGGKDSARRDGGASSRSRRSSASSRSGRESAASKAGEGAAREQPQKGEAEEGEKKPKRQEPKKSLKKAVNLSEAASKMHLLNKPPE
nr:uncharacterized protein LOC113805802 [Penaeus vannamei]